MRGKQTLFFAEVGDIEQAIRDIESLIQVRYFEIGMFESQNIPTYKSILDTPDVGIATSGDWNRTINYLILKNSSAVNVRAVPQKTGAIKFAVDQMINPGSIDLIQTITRYRAL